MMKKSNFLCSGLAALLIINSIGVSLTFSVGIQRFKASIVLLY